MQRLFSTFPDGWPGRELLLLPLAAGIVVVHHGAVGVLQARGSPFEVLSNSLAILGGISLLVGVWTPAAGVVVAASEVWIAVSAPVDRTTRILLASFSRWHWRCWARRLVDRFASVRKVTPHPAGSVGSA